MARPRRVSRVLVSGPLAPFADAYREALVVRRYTPLSAVNLQRQVRQLSEWLDAELRCRAAGRGMHRCLRLGPARQRPRGHAVAARLVVPPRAVARPRRGARCGAAGTVADGGADRVLPPLLAGRAWSGARHRPGLRGPGAQLRGRTRSPRALRPHAGRGHGGGAPRVDGGVGEHDAELRGQPAGLPPLLLPRWSPRDRPLGGGAADHRPEALFATPWDRQARGRRAAGVL